MESEKRERESIKLIDGYECFVDSMNYMLCRRKKNQKGEEYLTTIGYFSSLEGALRGLGKVLATDALENRSMTLTETGRTIVASNERLERFIALIWSVWQGGTDNY